METYCVCCKKNTSNTNSYVRKTKENRLTLLSNCAICGKKKKQLSLKVKTLNVFQMSSLKWIKS